MTASSVIYSFFNGTADKITTSALDAGGECISLMLTLLASMSFFNGIMKIAEASGITAVFGRILSPILKRLFPEIPAGDHSLDAMSMNITANMLGMGNAATPMGINAMKELNKLNGNKKRASRAMCMFTVINTASVQLIPTTVIAFRLNYGSVHPAVIIFPILLSSITGLAAGLISAQIYERREKDVC